MEISAIDLGERGGRDMDNLDALMADIALRGLVHDITVTPGRRLVLGARRLEACVRLGRTSIDATTVTTVQEALDRIERDAEGALCMHPLTVIEAICMDIAVRELEWWPKDGSTAKTGRRDIRREMMASHYGLNGRQYSVARRLVLASQGWSEYNGTRERLSAEEQERAKAALAIVRDPSDLNAALRLYQAGDSQPPPPVAPSRAPRRLPSRNQEEAVGSTISTLGGITAGLDAVGALEAIPGDVLQRWDRDLGAAIRKLTRFRKDVHDGYSGGSDG